MKCLRCGRNAFRAVVLGADPRTHRGGAVVPACVACDHIPVRARADAWLALIGATPCPLS